jgi:hypothetical protein
MVLIKINILLNRLQLNKIAATKQNKMIQNKLSKNVEGQNLINALTIKELEFLIPQLNKYLGQKIMTLNGKSKKFVYSHHTPEDKTFFRVHLDISKHSIWLKCDTCLQTSEFSVTYYKNCIYIGTMKDECLNTIESVEHIINTYNLSTLIDANKIQEKINKYKEIKNQLQEIERNFPLEKSLLNY